MPIDVEWQDERRRTLARYDGPFVTYRLVDAAPKHSVCLRFIDPYGELSSISARLRPWSPSSTACTATPARWRWPNHFSLP